MLLLSLLSPTFAASTGTDEMLSELERVQPNVIFLVDLSSDMSAPCDSTSTNSCLDDVKTAIEGVTRHFDWARYGVIGTVSDANSFDYYPIAPVGSSYGDIANALASVTPNSTSTRNIS